MEQDTTIFDKIGGRKFAVTLIAIVVGTVIEVTTERGVSEAMVMLLVGCIGVFAGSNALVSWKGLQVGTSEQVAQPEYVPQQDLSGLESAISSLQGEQQVQAAALQKATGLIQSLLSLRQQQ